MLGISEPLRKDSWCPWRLNRNYWSTLRSSLSNLRSSTYITRDEDGLSKARQDADDGTPESSPGFILILAPTLVFRILCDGTSCRGVTKADTDQATDGVPLFDSLVDSSPGGKPRVPATKMFRLSVLCEHVLKIKG